MVAKNKGSKLHCEIAQGLIKCGKCMEGMGEYSKGIGYLHYVIEDYHISLLKRNSLYVIMVMLLF